MTKIAIGNKIWNMRVNGDKGVMLTCSNPVQVQFIECQSGETSQDVYNKLVEKCNA
jgi:hypothetical protein